MSIDNIVAHENRYTIESKVTRLCEENNTLRLGGDFCPFKSFLLGSFRAWEKLKKEVAAGNSDLENQT